MVREKAWNVHLSLVLCQVVCRSRPRARVSGRRAAGVVREIPRLHVGGRYRGWTTGEVRRCLGVTGGPLLFFLRADACLLGGFVEDVGRRSRGPRIGTPLRGKQSRTWPHPGLRVLGEEVGAEAVLQSRPNEIRITLKEEEARPPLTRLRSRDLTEFDGGLVLL